MNLWKILSMLYFLPYSDKRKQLLKMKFLVNEQNVSVIYIDINAISIFLDINIFQQDECFWSKLELEVEYSKSNLKTSLSQIWVICHLLPFVRVRQLCSMTFSPFFFVKGMLELVVTSAIFGFNVNGRFYLCMEINELDIAWQECPLLSKYTITVKYILSYSVHFCAVYYFLYTNYLAVHVYPQLRARRALLLFKDVLLRTRRVLLLYKVYGNSILLVLNKTAFNSVDAFLALGRPYI